MNTLKYFSLDILEIIRSHLALENPLSCTRQNVLPTTTLSLQAVIHTYSAHRLD